MTGKMTDGEDIVTIVGAAAEGSDRLLYRRRRRRNIPSVPALAVVFALMVRRRKA
jgi:hypothetical protein